MLCLEWRCVLDGGAADREATSDVWFSSLRTDSWTFDGWTSRGKESQHGTACAKTVARKSMYGQGRGV